ncbi:Hypothetical protein RY70_427 [Bifidobacterium bifidum]|nr:Hypothetical protein RY70_427 [Bifidobacterium bifidum]
MSAEHALSKLADTISPISRKRRKIAENHKNPFLYLRVLRA